VVKIASAGRPKTDGKDFEYSYNIRYDNLNGLSLKQLSTVAGSIMTDGGGEYFEDFAIFAKFYGQTDYADRWVTAAADKVSTDFSSGYVLGSVRTQFDHVCFQNSRGFAC
jgi:hypothetical protein